jgi:8-oxo-dGTP pyrophosphatase MutT (NUDIX family)
VEDGEDPEETCRRELKEEAGLEAERIVRLGSCFADTGRFENRLHAFFVEASDPAPDFVPEPGIELVFVDAGTLRDYILAGRFQQQMHVGVLAQASLMGIRWEGAPK